MTLDGHHSKCEVASTMDPQRLSMDGSPAPVDGWIPSACRWDPLWPSGWADLVKQPGRSNYLESLHRDLLG